MPPRRTASTNRAAAAQGVAPKTAPGARAAAGLDRARLPERTAAVAYYRVSSKDQEKEGFSIPAQQRLLRDYADGRGIRIDAEFTDVETAKRAGREQFGAMIAWLKKHKGCRVVLVEKTDRLYRNMRDYVTLNDLGLELHFVKEGQVISEDSKSSDKFMHGIKVVMAKNYVDNLSEETKKGMAEKAEQGIWPGAAPVGYVNVVRPDGKKVIAVDPEKGPLVRELFKEYALGSLSISALSEWAAARAFVSERTGKPLSVQALHYLLTNLIYTGEFSWHGRVYKGIHEPLVTRELWDRVQAKMQERSPYSARPKHHDFAFAGLIGCGLCADEGHKRMYVGEIQKGKYVYYHCDRCRREKRATYVREEVLDAAIAKALRVLRLSDEMLAWVRDGLRMSHTEEQAIHAETLDRLMKQYQTLQRRIDLAWEDRLDGRVPVEVFERKSAEWRAQQSELRREIEKHEAANQSFLEEGIALVEAVSRASEMYEARTSTAEKRELLQYLLSNSIWRNGDLEVVWRKPFDIIAKSLTEVRENDNAVGGSDGVTQKWLPLLDLNQRPSD